LGNFNCRLADFPDDRGEIRRTRRLRSHSNTGVDFATRINPGAVTKLLPWTGLEIDNTLCCEVEKIVTG